MSRYILKNEEEKSKRKLPVFKKQKQITINGLLDADSWQNERNDNDYEPEDPRQAALLLVGDVPHALDGGGRAELLHIGVQLLEDSHLRR